MPVFRDIPVRFFISHSDTVLYRPHVNMGRHGNCPSSLLYVKQAQFPFVRITSHPARGAWIEIAPSPPSRTQCRRSRPTRGAWIEIACVPGAARRQSSRPTRGAWIEIAAPQSQAAPPCRTSRRAPAKRGRQTQTAKISNNDRPEGQQPSGRCLSAPFQLTTFQSPFSFVRTKTTAIQYHTDRVLSIKICGKCPLHLTTKYFLLTGW